MEVEARDLCGFPQSQRMQRCQPLSCIQFSCASLLKEILQYSYAEETSEVPRLCENVQCTLLSGWITSGLKHPDVPQPTAGLFMFGPQSGMQHWLGALVLSGDMRSGLQKA